MLFNSHIFILCFLPGTLAVYFLVNRYLPSRAGRYVLIAASLAFALYADMISACVLIGSVGINFWLSRHVAHSPVKKAVLLAGVVFNIGLLAVFKYSNTVFEGIEDWVGSETILRIALPLGISFYTFQQIAYLVDIYKGSVEPAAFSDYLLAVSFFPKLAQGPICACGSLAPQFEDPTRKSVDWERFSRALFLFAVGLTKKVMVADQFGKIVDYGFSSISKLNSFEALLSILAYTFQLYFDFSGYSDMAIAVAMMFNIDLPQNFNSPYKALSISDFWKRWHMTLTGFLTRYVYIPLGGSRKGIVRTCVNIMIVYLVSGIWHGTGITFLLWGTLHGAAMILHRLFRDPYDRLPKIIRWLATFLFINVTWVFFRAGSVSEAVDMLRQVFVGGWEFYINPELTETLLQPTLISAASRFLTLPVVAVAGVAVSIFVATRMDNSMQMTERFKPGAASWIVTYIMLVLSILSVSGVSTFLYTNF